MPTFTNHAHGKMMDLYRNHGHEVGSQIAGAYPSKTPTDCITYIINVLGYAFGKTGNSAAAAKVRTLGEYGTKLAKYLVATHGWKGVYYNPDVNHPRDGDMEHPYSYYKKVLLSKQYYEIPISHWAINYNPTPKSDANYKSFSGIGGAKDETDLEVANFDELKKIKFGAGVSRGGAHTWLYSSGKVYEVHWDQIGTGLYEASDLKTYPWLSGAVVIPPDAYVAAKFDTGSFFDTLLDLLR